MTEMDFIAADVSTGDRIVVLIHGHSIGPATVGYMGDDTIRLLDGGHAWVVAYASIDAFRK